MSPTSKKRKPHDKKEWEEKKIDSNSVAGRMRAARNETGLSTRKLADLIPGVSNVTITHIENAKTDPEIDTVYAILQKLRELLGDERYAKHFPLDLDLIELKRRGKLSEQIISQRQKKTTSGKVMPLTLTLTDWEEIRVIMRYRELDIDQRALTWKGLNIAKDKEDYHEKVLKKVS